MDKVWVKVIPVNVQSLPVAYLYLFLLILVICSNYTAPKNSRHFATAQDYCCQSHSSWIDQETTPTPIQKLEGIQIPSEEVNQQCDSSDSCAKYSPKLKRYILYKVNSGEGFNLQRDIFVRIGPLIKALNWDTNVSWTLVLPPWTSLPHWTTTPHDESYPWSVFFQVEEIARYIPVLEFESFLQERAGLKGPIIDTLIKLAHLPFPKPGEEKASSWEERVKVEENCKSDPFHKFDATSKLYQGRVSFWTGILTVAKIQCLSIRGTAKTLRRHLEKEVEGKESVAILLNDAEVILWDSYGGDGWWRARAALKFATNLVQLAKSRALQNFAKDDQASDTYRYISLHLRRRDFLLRKSSSDDGSGPPSIKDVAEQIRNLCKKLQIFSLFLATDAEESETDELKSLLNQDKIDVWTYPCPKSSSLTDGECAIIEQILASHWSTYFLGTEGSTFTLRIFEERLLLGKSPDSTYNYICAKSAAAISTCRKPTRWLIPESVKHLVQMAQDLNS